MNKAKVAILKTKPESVLDDIQKLMRMADYENYLAKDAPTLIKLNLSWTKYFPSCSSEPWQLDGVVKTLLEDGFAADRLIAIENKTVVTDPIKGAKNNKWSPILEKYGVPFVPLPDAEWIKYEFKDKLLKLDQIFYPAK